MEQSYLCQKCRATFLGSEIREVQLPKNFRVSNPISSVWEKDGRQYVPGCPKCDNTFFFLQFNTVNPKEENNAQTDAN